MITVVPFAIGHYDSMYSRLRFHDMASVNTIGRERYRECLEEIEDTQPALTFLCEDQVAAVAGVINKWEGVGQYWMLTTPLVEKHTLSFIKRCRVALEDVRESMSLHRIEASIAESHKISQRWAEFMGFKKEGLMEGYCSDGSNHYLYARTWLWQQQEHSY